MRLDAFSQGLLAATNKVRADAGLPALTVNAWLAAAAQEYATFMAENDWFAHAGPDGANLAVRAGAAGYTGSWLGEVLYTGPKTDEPGDVVALWLGSPSHRGVLLAGQFTEAGVGCAASDVKRWCVEDFGSP